MYDNIVLVKPVYVKVLREGESDYRVENSSSIDSSILLSSPLENGDERRIELIIITNKDNYELIKSKRCSKKGAQPPSTTPLHFNSLFCGIIAACLPVLVCLSPCESAARLGK